MKTIISESSATYQLTKNTTGRQAVSTTLSDSSSKLNDIGSHCKSVTTNTITITNNNNNNNSNSSTKMEQTTPRTAYRVAAATDDDNAPVESNHISAEQTQTQQIDAPNSKSISLAAPNNSLKHSHSLRRHVPRIIVKPIVQEKKSITIPTVSTASTITPSASNAVHRGGQSRRLQQQQQLKTAAALASASATAAGSTPSMPLTKSSLDSVGSAAAATMTSVAPATIVSQASTMREVLASIPGFSLKPRRRSSKKISTAAQIEQTKDGKIDLETPDSILASTNLRALLNKQTFSLLPPLYQYNLIQLLPSVDREAIEMEQKTPIITMPIEAIRLGPSSLNNEFFARACLEWRERLSEGEFTPENQMKLKTEAEREKNKLDPWKLKHFEPIWGDKCRKRIANNNNVNNDTHHTSSNCAPATTNAMRQHISNSNELTRTCTTEITKLGTNSDIKTDVDALASCSGNSSAIGSAITAEKSNIKQKPIADDVRKAKEVVESTKNCDKIELKSEGTIVAHKFGTSTLNFPQLKSSASEASSCNSNSSSNSTGITRLNNKRASASPAKHAVESSQGLAYNEDDDDDSTTYGRKCKVKRSDIIELKSESSDSNMNATTLKTQIVNVDAPTELQHLRDSESLKRNHTEATANALTDETVCSEATSQELLQLIDEDISEIESDTNTATTKSNVFSVPVSISASNSVASSSSGSSSGSGSGSGSSSSSGTFACSTTATTNMNTTILMQSACDRIQSPISLPLSSSLSSSSIISSTHVRSTTSSTQQNENIQKPAATKLATSAPTSISISQRAVDNPNDMQLLNATVEGMHDIDDNDNHHMSLESLDDIADNNHDGVDNDDDDDLDAEIEQKFADAENFLLESGEVMVKSDGDNGKTTESSTNSALLINLADHQKDSITQELKLPLICSSDNAIISQGCDHDLEANKIHLTTNSGVPSRAGYALSSLASMSSSTSSTSSLSTSTTVIASSSSSSSSVTSFCDAAPANSLSSSMSTFATNFTLQPASVNNTPVDKQSSSVKPAVLHNEIFQHVQHDWNFGEPKASSMSCYLGDIFHEHGSGISTSDASNSNENGDSVMVSPIDNDTEEDYVHNDGCQFVIDDCDDDMGENKNNVDDDEDEDDDDVDDGDADENNVIGDAEEDDDEDDVDDVDANGLMAQNDNVKNIVDNLRQQHQQEQQFMPSGSKLYAQAATIDASCLQQQHQTQQLHQVQQPEFSLQQKLEFTNELTTDALCNVPFSVAEMEVTSTVMTNSNSNDSSTELHLCGTPHTNTSGSGSNGTATNATNNSLNLNAAVTITQQLAHHQQQPQQQHNVTHNAPPPPTQQRQILVDSNGHIIGNILVQQHQQHQLLQHAAQQFTIQAAQQQQQQQQQPQQQQQVTPLVTTQALSQPSHHQQQQSHPQKPIYQPLTVMRKSFEINTNATSDGHHHYAPRALAVHHASAATVATTAQQQTHPQIQQFMLHQQHQSHLDAKTATNTATVTYGNDRLNSLPAQHIQIQQLQSPHQQPPTLHQHQTLQQQIANFSQVASQQQQQPQPQQRFAPKQINVISLPTRADKTGVAVASALNAFNSFNSNSSCSTASTSSSSSSSSSASSAGSSTSNFALITNISPNAATLANLNATTIKVLPPGTTATAVSTNTAHHIARPPAVKATSGKGRKAASNKLPPGAVNLERSYQICQAVIQSSPNRENLKAQLRPPPAILNQQQQQQQQIELNSNSNTSGHHNVASISHVKTTKIQPQPAISMSIVGTQQPQITEETLTTNILPPGIASSAASVMGVGRPGVYKVVTPHMRFPRKKYVQRKSPTMLRDIFTMQNATAATVGGTNASIMNVGVGVGGNMVLDQHQNHHPHAQHQQLTMLPKSEIMHPQAEIHRNNGQFVLVHRASLVSADAHAPRASSAPPVPQNQNQLHNINGMPITGRGRPASVDVDTSVNTQNDIPKISYINAPTTQSLGNNINAGNVTCNTSGEFDGGIAISDGNHLVMHAGAATTTPATTKLCDKNLTQAGNVCACSLNAMVICQQCGAFYHNDCISGANLCLSCVIR